MAAAKRGDLLLERDRCDCPIFFAAGDANVNGTDRNRSDIELIGDGGPVDRG